MNTPVHLPEPRAWLVKWFCRYAQNRLRRDFHQMRLFGPPPPALPGPLVAYANHVSWWDPLVALAMQPRLFPKRRAFAPMDAEMLNRYGIFKWMGFFGVNRSSPRGVFEFLERAESVLHRPESLLYLTPQGRFADVRQRPPGFQGGIGFLAERVPGAVFLPIAAEYVFWEESKPEILLHFGKPQKFAGQIDRHEANQVLEQALASAQSELGTAAIERNADRFDTLLRGRHGVGGIYDVARRLRSWAAGEPFSAKHGKV